MNTKLKNKVLSYLKYATKPSQDVEVLFTEDSYAKELEEAARTHWENEDNKEIDLDHVYKRICQKAGIVDKKTTYRRLFIISNYLKIAAIFFIILLLGFSYFIYTQNNIPRIPTTIHSPGGSRVDFTLADGSRVHLNGESTISFTSDFIKSRKLNLSGEAYFDVKQDSNHPFRVITNKVNITVLGTEFNICAYPEDEKVTTTLKRGCVQINDQINHQQKMLYPNQQNTIDLRTGHMTTKKVDVTQYTSWTNNLLRVENASLIEATKKIERWYGVTIHIDPQLKIAGKYSFSITNESLKDVLDLLSLTSPFRYSIEKNNVSITKK